MTLVALDLNATRVRAATGTTNLPDPLMTPLPEAPGEDAVAGADALKAQLTEHSGTVGSFIDRRDAFGFTVGDTRFSLWSVLVVVLVIICVILAARGLPSWRMRSMRSGAKWPSCGHAASPNPR